MAGIAPASFTVTGSGFTPSGTVQVTVLNSSSSVVASSNTTADATGAINVSIPSSQILPIGLNNPGTYNGFVQCVDTSTNQASNAAGVSLVVQSGDVVTLNVNTPTITGSGLSAVVTINGSASSSEGSITSISWVSTDGFINFANASFPQTFSNFASPGVKTLTIKATDSLGNSASQQVSFTITAPPNPHLTVQGTINLNQNVTFNVTGMTPNGKWSLRADGNTFTGQFTADASGNGTLPYSINPSSQLYAIISTPGIGAGVQIQAWDVSSGLLSNSV